MPTPILCYRKSAKTEGWSTIIGVLATVLGMAIFQAILFPIFWDQWNGVFVIVFFAIEAVVMGMLCHYAWVHLNAPEEFDCRLDERELRCTIPVPGCGESFSLPLDKIERLEKEMDDGSWRWFVCGSGGERYQLTINYDNPVKDFVDALCKLRPNLKVVEKNS